MAKIIKLPTKVDYSVSGIARSGKIIVNFRNSNKCFTMHAEDIVASNSLISHFPKSHVEWLCDVVAASDFRRNRTGL